jgi:nitric oxide reductase NorD protein
MVNRFSNKQDNFSLYKCITVHLWAQTWFGTWSIDHESLFADFPDRQKALSWFQALESIRLDACVERELPGLHREMIRLTQLADQTPPMQLDIPDKHLLLEKHASVHSSVRLLKQVYQRDPPRALHYAGSLQPQRVAQVRDARIAREKDLFRKALAHLQQEKTGKPASELTSEEKAANSCPTRTCPTALACAWNWTANPCRYRKTSSRSWTPLSRTWAISRTNT